MSNSRVVGHSPAPAAITDYHAFPDASGHFGIYGGTFVSETLIAPLAELAAAYDHYRVQAEFIAEMEHDYKHYVGRPSPIYEAERLSKHVGGARILLKREDLNHTGAHKINNTIGQAMLAKRMGKTRIIAETGAGQHGVASATVAARLGLKCVVYMGAVDIERQAINVYRMKLLGAEVVAVHSGSKTLKDALNEAMRDWVSNVHDTFYIIGTAAGPSPYPRMVRDFNAVVGRESRAQMMESYGRLPDAIVACVGGGSNAIGAVSVSNLPSTQVVSGSVTVTALPALPTGSNTIGAVLQAGSTGTDFSVNASTTGTQISTFSYNFGDGVTLDSKDSTVTHTYAKAGNYTVSVKVKTTDGQVIDSSACSTTI